MSQLLSCLRNGIFASALFMSIGMIPAGPAHAENAIEVMMNQAKIVRLAVDADTIIVGNPLIADAAVQDSRTIVLTGKGFGVTNIVVMDQEGNPIIDEEVYVRRNASRTLRVYRRAVVQTLSCTPYCEGAYKSEAEQASDAEMSVGSQ